MASDISTAKLDPNIFTNRREYFFSFLVDRFEYATLLWKEALQDRFQRPFEPIFVVSARSNQYFQKANFLVMNQRAQKVQRDTGEKNFIFLSENEDLNQEFSRSSYVKDFIRKLILKQKRVFLLPFTTTNLSFNSSKVIVLGPDSKVVTKYDNKVQHKLLFDKLGLSKNEVKIFKNLAAVQRTVKQYPIFLSASFSSGGHESRIISNPAQIDSFSHELRGINRNNEFLVARFIEDVVLSPNTNAIVVGRNNTVVNCISDQILRSNQYIGNIYPSKATERHKGIMRKTTAVVGNYLSRKGFRGIFGLDFIIDKNGSVFPTDLNPRRQGGYLCHILSARSKGIDLIDLELRIFLHNDIPDISYPNFQVDYVWAHSKIKPYKSGQKITRVFASKNPSTPFMKKGAAYKAMFYPKGYVFAGGNAGYYITTGTSYDQTLQKIRGAVGKIIETSFDSTDWEFYFDSPKTHDLLQ
ncbi:ATP-grasp domain-containing protein [Patescibacteria group bacterium]|nr:ATP-grasp domain-containing protein [Patescibacteria group bacterium]